VAGSGAVSNAALPLAGIEAKGQVMGPISGVVDGVVNRNGEGQHVGDNHNYIEEVIHSNNDDLGLIIAGFPAVTGRLEQPLNRR